MQGFVRWSTNKSSIERRLPNKPSMNHPIVREIYLRNNKIIKVSWIWSISQAKGQIADRNRIIIANVYNRKNSERQCTEETRKKLARRICEHQVATKWHYLLSLISVHEDHKFKFENVRIVTRSRTRYSRIFLTVSNRIGNLCWDGNTLLFVQDWRILSRYLFAEQARRSIHSNSLSLHLVFQLVH